MNGRLPRTLFGGRMRTSTALLGMAFVGVLLLWVAVRPDPAEITEELVRVRTTRTVTEENSAERRAPAPVVRPPEVVEPTPTPTPTRTPAPRVRRTPVPTAAKVSSATPTVSEGPTVPGVDPPPERPGLLGGLSPGGGPSDPANAPPQESGGAQPSPSVQ